MNSKQLLDEIVQSTERLSARVDSFAAKRRFDDARPDGNDVESMESDLAALRAELRTAIAAKNQEEIEDLKRSIAMVERAIASERGDTAKMDDLPTFMDMLVGLMAAGIAGPMLKDKLQDLYRWATSSEEKAAVRKAISEVESRNDQASDPGLFDRIMESIWPNGSTTARKPEPAAKTFSAGTASVPSPSSKLLPSVEFKGDPRRRGWLYLISGKNSERLDSVAASVAKLTPRIDAFCGRSDAKPK